MDLLDIRPAPRYLGPVRMLMPVVPLKEYILSKHLRPSWGFGEGKRGPKQKTLGLLQEWGDH